MFYENYTLSKYNANFRIKRINDLRLVYGIINSPSQYFMPMAILFIL